MDIRKEVEKNARGIDLLSAKSRSVLEQMLIEAPEGEEALAEYLEAKAPPLIDACANNASALGIQTYNRYRVEQIGHAIDMDYMPEPEDYTGIIRTAVSNAKNDRSLVAEYLGGYLDNKITHSYADTMIKAGLKDKNKVRFARVPSGINTCDFCMMLASRGFVYVSEKTAGQFTKYHSFCRCQIVPSFKAQDAFIKGYNPDELYARYKNGEYGFTSNGKGAKKPRKVRYDTTHKPVISNPIQADSKPTDLPSKAYGGEWNQREDMETFLKSVFDDDDYVGTCSDFFLRDGRLVPGKGLYQRTAKHIEGVLDRTGNVASAVGRYRKETGVYVRINPLDGKGITDMNVKSFKYALIEADVGTMEEQYGWIKALNLPTKAVVTSGNKSVHALVRIDAENYEQYKERVALLHAECQASGYMVDGATKNPSRYMRLPGVNRSTGRQVLVSTDEGARSWDEWRAWADKNR